MQIVSRDRLLLLIVEGVPLSICLKDKEKLRRFSIISAEPAARLHSDVCGVNLLSNSMLAFYIDDSKFTTVRARS